MTSSLPPIRTLKAITPFTTSLRCYIHLESNSLDWHATFQQMENLHMPIIRLYADRLKIVELFNGSDGTFTGRNSDLIQTTAFS